MLGQIVATVVVLFLSRFLWRRWKYDLHKVPSPPGLPLLGHTLDMIFGKEEQRVQYLGNKFKRLGYPKLMRVSIAISILMSYRMSQLKFLGKGRLVVSDVDFIRNAMMSKTRPFPRSDAGLYALIPLVGNDMTTKFLFTETGLSPYVKEIRKIYATLVQAQNLKKATPDILSRIDKLIEIIDHRRKDGQVDMKELLTKLTLDVIGMVALEINMGGLDGSRDIHQLFKEVKYITMDNFKNPMLLRYYKLFPWLREAQRRKDKIQKLWDAYAELVQFCQQREDPPEGETPMWYALKTMKDPETGEPLSFNTLLAEVAMVVVSGIDTTGQQLGWILILLASYPTVTEKLLEELKEYKLYGPGSHEVQFDDVGDLSYLTAVIKECMRIAPIVAGSGPRRVPEDMTILGYRIPKGMAILAPGTRAVFTEEVWGDPEVFRPERWLVGEDMSNKYHFPFSVGPRDCIGQRLAMLELRLTTVKLVTRYALRTEENWRELLNSARDGIVMESKKGIWLHMTPRHDMESV